MEYRFYLYHRDVGNWTPINDPKGWDGLGRTIKRYGIDNAVGQKWHGMFYEYSSKIAFTKKGKSFIQGFKELYGIEQEILLKIETRDTATRSFTTEYIGRLDLTDYRVSDIYLETKVENTGFIQKIKNALDVKVDLSKLVSQGDKAIEPFANETHNITLHSKVLLRESTLKAAKTIGTFDVVPATTYYILFPFDESVADELLERFTYPMQVGTDDPVADLKYHMLVKEPGDYTFNLHMEIGIKNSFAPLDAAWQVKWYLKTGKPGSYTTTQIGADINSSGAFGYTERELLAHEVTLAKNDEVYIYATYVLTGSGNATFDLVSYNSHTDGFPTDPAPDDKFSQVQILGETQVETSDCKIIMAHEAWARVLQSITDTPLPFYSEYYGRTDSAPVAYASDGAGSLRGITNGKNVRTIDVPIHCTLRNLVDTFAGIDGVGIGIEKVNGVERVRVEPITYWYQTKSMMRLDFVKNPEKEEESSLYFNQVEAGPTKWEMESINNLDEVNTKKEWTLPITQLKNLLDLKIPYITGGYPLEFTRREKDEPTKDTRYDDDNFVIDLVRIEGGFAPAKDEAFSSVTGVISPDTAYNLDLSPRRCLERNGRLIRTGLHKLTSKSIKFAFGEGNSAMSSTKTGGAAVVENADIAVNTLASPLFLPEVYNIKVALTKAQRDILKVTDLTAENNIYQYIEWSKTDKDHKRGYVIEARPASNSKEVVLKLLRANV